MRTDFRAADVARQHGGKPISTGGYLCRCPVKTHGKGRGDRNPSLTVDDGDKGLVVNCKSGCDPRDVLAALGYQPNGTNGRHHEPPKPFSDRGLTSAGYQQTAVYDYTTPESEMLYQVVRYEHPTKEKTFRQRRPDGRGGWWADAGSRKVLYRGPDLAKHGHLTAYVCEGEKDADRLASLGFLAVAVASGSWSQEAIEALQGYECFILEDNDKPGREKAQKAAKALHGVARSVRVVRLPNLGDGEDVSDWLDQGGTPDRLREIAGAAPVWRADGDETDTEAEKPLPFVDVAAWDGAPVPAREWAVVDVIPSRNVTLLTGQGGGGKTTLALQLCVATVLGRDWLTHLPEPGKAMIICCEDDVDEMHRRFDHIAAYYNVSYSDLARGGLYPLSFAGQDAVLAAPDRAGVLRPTPLFHRIAAAARAIRPKLIVLDNAADVYAGNENERGMVRQFITLLRGLAIDADAAVLLTLHPSLTGISTGTGLSGNTAWFNSVRGQLYLKTATTGDGETPDPDLRELEARKNNYGPLASTTMLRWRNGVFVVERSNASTLDKLAAAQKADDLFLKLLDRFNRQSRNVSDKRSVSYAPSLFAKEQEARDAGLNRQAFEAAMARLFAASQIRLEQYGRPSNPHWRLVRDDAV